MSKVFQIEGTDKRRELINAYRRDEDSFLTQKRTGKGVEYFSPETGFVLLEKQAKLNLQTRIMRRVLSCAKLSMGEPLELRERKSRRGFFAEKRFSSGIDSNEGFPLSVLFPYSYLPPKERKGRILFGASFQYDRLRPLFSPIFITL